MITDEMWEKFTQALADTGTMRAALEAVAPVLIAQGMRKSAYMYRDWLSMQSPGGAFEKYLIFQANEFEWRSKGEFTRAQELDPK